VRGFNILHYGSVLVRLFEKPRFRFSFGFHEPEPRFRFDSIFYFVLFSALSVNDSAYNEWLVMF